MSNTFESTSHLAMGEIGLTNWNHIADFLTRLLFCFLLLIILDNKSVMILGFCRQNSCFNI